MNAVRPHLPSRPTLLLALVVGFAVAAAGCGDDTGASEQPLVVATTTVLGDIVGQLVGDEARIEVLMPIGADPHSYEVSARQAALLREADLVVANGLGLEGSLLGAIEAAEEEGIAVIRVAEHLDPEPFVTAGDGHDADDEHEEGLDPHVWMDPIRMRRGVELLASRLTDAGIGGAAARAEAYAADLAELSAFIDAQISAIDPGDRKLVTNHFAYGYYARRYGLELVGTVIPAATTSAETSAAEFAELVEIIEREDVRAIFGSTTEPVELAEAIAEQVGFEVRVIQLHTGSLGEEGSGAETYLGMMRTATERIVEALASN